MGKEKQYQDYKNWLKLSFKDKLKRNVNIAKNFLSEAPSINNIANAAKAITGGYNPENPYETKAIVDIDATPYGIGKVNKINKIYKSVKRGGMDAPMRSNPMMDIFRLQLPSFKTGSLGKGHKYRAIGNAKGLKDVKKNGIVSKGKAYKNADQVYWAENEPLREYTGNSALMVSYDKNGKYVFQKGNFDNPVSSEINPISLFDENVKLHGRYPFMSKYHEIPKTEKGFKHAEKLGKLNTFVEQPVKLGVKGYLGYKTYKYLNDK